MAMSRSQLVEQERRKLLLLKQEFIEDICKFRSQHSIPAGGYGDNPEGKKYYDLMYQLADQYCDEQERTRHKEVTRLLDTGKKKESRELGRLINQQNPLNAMIADSRRLSEKYAITGAIKDRGLESFLITGNEDSFINDLFQTRFSIQPASGSRDVQWVDIRIYKHTRKKDIADLWPEIRRWQKMMIGNNKQKTVPSNLIDRDIAIYKSVKSGKSKTKVADEYGKTYKDIDTICRNTDEKIRRS
ncbi:hypothetical protein BH23PAT2_BH23PAT2_07340 [soil metagenome]